MEVSQQSGVRVQEFSRCTVDIWTVKKKHSPRVPKDFITGPNIQLNIGLGDFGIGYLIESSLQDHLEGTTVHFKTKAAHCKTKLTGFAGNVHSKTYGPAQMRKENSPGRDDERNEEDGMEAQNDSQDTQNSPQDIVLHRLGVETESGDSDSEGEGGDAEGTESREADQVDASEDSQPKIARFEDVRGRTFEFCVFLRAIEPSKEISDLSPQEKLERALRLKEAGTRSYQKGNVDLAFRRYSRALKYCICIGQNPGAELEQELKTLTSQCYFNMAACHQQKDNHTAVIYCCSQGLLVCPRNVKGLYRRSQALSKLKRFAEAAEDLKEATAIEPSNKTILQHLRTVNEAIKKSSNAMAEAMSKMFVG